MVHELERETGERKRKRGREGEKGYLGERVEVIRERGRPSQDLDRALAGVSLRFAEKTMGERGGEEREGEDWVDGDEWAMWHTLFKTFLFFAR